MQPGRMSKLIPFLAIRNSVHFHSLIVQGISAAFGTITSLCYIWWMDISSVGVLVLFITAATIVDMLRSGFLQPALVRYSRVKDDHQRRGILGASLLLGLFFTVCISALVAAAIPFTDLFSDAPTITLFIYGLPLLYLVTYPGQYATWKAQAELRFDRILAYRCLVSSSVLTGVVLVHIFAQLTPESVVVIFTISGLIGSGFTLFMGWVSLGNISHLTTTSITKLVRFGRYSMTTQLGVSLLKSSDTFVIGALLSPSFVAIYSLAQKVAEVLELPLRALSASVYPIMAEQGVRKNFPQLVRIIEQVTSGYVLALIVPSVILFLMSDMIVSVLAGAAYAHAGQIIRIFIVAALLLPLDRMIGIGLDSLGRPDANMAKVLLMLLLNVVGDVIALQLTGSLISVAVVTVLMTSSGIVLGLHWLRPNVVLSASRCTANSIHWLNPSYLMYQIEKSRLNRN